MQRSEPVRLHATVLRIDMGEGRKYTDVVLRLSDADEALDVVRELWGEECLVLLLPADATVGR